MSNTIFGRIVLLITVTTLNLDLSESKCMSRFCDQQDEANVLALSTRNQEVVEQLQREPRVLRSKTELNADVVGRLAQEVRTLKTEAEHTQRVVGRLQQEIGELKKELAIQGKYFVSGRYTKYKQHACVLVTIVASRLQQQFQ